MKAVVFEVTREGYDIDQVRRPMTVGELQDILYDLDEETIVILSHDGGYTFGSLPRACDIFANE